MNFFLFFLLALTAAVPHGHNKPRDMDIHRTNMNMVHKHNHHQPMLMNTHHHRQFTNISANSTASGNAIIQNACAFPLYLWSVGSTISPQHTLPPYHIHREPFRHDDKSGGVAIKVTTQPNGLFTGKPQTIFAYNLNRNESRVWYDLSDVFGDPFEGSEVKVQPASPAIRWMDGVPPRGSQVRVVDAREDLKVDFC